MIFKTKQDSMHHHLNLAFGYCPPTHSHGNWNMETKQEADAGITVGEKDGTSHLSLIYPVSAKREAKVKGDTTINTYTPLT